jgi:hypothetical protein
LNIKDIINKIPWGYFAIYYLLFCIWSILYFAVFPAHHIFLTFSVLSITVFFRIIYLRNNLDRIRLIYGSCFIGIIALIILLAT